MKWRQTRGGAGEVRSDLQDGELGLLYRSPSSVVCFCPFVSNSLWKYLKVLGWVIYIMATVSLVYFRIYLTLQRMWLPENIPRDVRIITFTRLSPKPFSYLKNSPFYFHHPQENKSAEVVWEAPSDFWFVNHSPLPGLTRETVAFTNIIMGHKTVFSKTWKIMHQNYENTLPSEARYIGSAVPREQTFTHGAYSHWKWYC